MAKQKKKVSIKAEYDKIRITGWSGNPFASKVKPTVSISLRELGYEPAAADVDFTVAEAEEIIKLIERAIKDANNKEKN